jgi:hypothetical protein
MLKLNSQITASYMDDGIHTQGQSMPPMQELSERSILIANAEKTIHELAKKDGLDKVVTTILANSAPALRMYVNGQRETPETDLRSLAMQTAMLRIADTAVIARNNDINDYNATCLLESVENDLIKKHHFNTKYLLPHETQAAINIIIDKVVDKHKNSGGSGRLIDISDELKKSAANYFMADATPKTVDGVIYYNDHPDAEIITMNNTGGVSQVQPTGGVLDFIDKAIEVIEDIGGGIQTIGTTAGDAIDKLKDKATDLGGDIAAGSFQKAMMKNLPLIIGIVALITVVILIIIYVAKPKR